MIAGAYLMIVAWLAILASVETALDQAGIHRVRRMLQGPGQNANGSGADDATATQSHSQVLTTLLVLRLMLLLGLGCLVGMRMQAADPHPILIAITLGACGLTVLAAEVVARQLGMARSSLIAERTLPFWLGVSRVIFPLVWLLQRLSHLFVARSGSLAASLEDIHEEVRQLQRQGLLEQEETQIIQSVFAFGETIAKEVMVPRVDMVCIELGSTLSQVLELMIQCGHTRLPVYHETVDNILGLVHAKDLLGYLEDAVSPQVRQNPLTRDFLRDILVVPGTKKISKILRELQRDKIAMAIVVDEYGGTDGLLTLEDIVEEIVGEIVDEYDQASEGVQILKDGSSIVDAKIVIEDVNEVLNLQLPHADHETLGGYVYSLFERVPQTGDKVEGDGLEFTAESVQRQRITRVRIKRLEDTTGSVPAAPVPALS